MKNSKDLPKTVSRENGDLAKNKRQEADLDFKKQNIYLAFVDICEQLKQLAQAHLDGNISKTRHFITIQEITNRIFEAANEALYGINMHEFASHEPGDKTPLNSRCC